MLKERLLSLYSVYKKQEKIINGIESGVYTFKKQGIKIPDTEKTIPVIKENFPILFKLLEKSKSSVERKEAGSTFNRGNLRPFTRGNQ